jgi:hypothetical protein
MGACKAIALALTLSTITPALIQAQPAPAPSPATPDTRQAPRVERDDDTDWGWIGLLGLLGLFGLMKRDRDRVNGRTTTTAR